MLGFRRKTIDERNMKRPLTLLFAFAFLLVSCSVYDNYSEDAYNEYYGLGAYATVPESSNSSSEIVANSSSSYKDDASSSSIKIEDSSSSIQVPQSSSAPVVDVSSSSEIVASSSSSVVEPSSSSVKVEESSSSVVEGSSSSSVFSCMIDEPFVDSKGREFAVVKIATQCWFSENLNVETAKSRCYDDDPANCETFGRLYNFAEASSICPEGTHLPSSAEFETLKNYYGKNAGLDLKSDVEWDEKNGTGASGFYALPGGFYDGDYSGKGFFAGFWSSSEKDSDQAEYWQLSDSDYLFVQSLFEKSVFLSVRCIVD